MTMILTMLVVWCIASLPCAIAIGCLMRRGGPEWGDSRAS